MAIPQDKMSAYMAQGNGRPPKQDESDNDNDDGDGTIDWAEEMADWLEGLDADEPELAEALGMLGDAIEAGDEGTIADAWGLVATAMQMGNPVYPALSKDEQAEASRLIGKHYGDYPREQAIAIGLRQAAPEKYQRFDSART